MVYAVRNWIGVMVCLFSFLVLNTCGKDSPTRPTTPTTPTTPVPSRVLITPSAANLKAIGQTVQLKASVVDANSNPIPAAAVSWSSANTAVATVSPQGLVTAVENGITQITVRSGSATGRATVTVMGPDLEREVLVKLYNATDGRNWTNQGGWLSEGTVGSWHGVTTDVNGRVTRLSLHENSLRGTLIPELGMLASLETLALSSNQLTGNIPPDIGQLANLKLLYLWGNQLTGTIPQELGQLTRLEKLDLSSNQLTGTIPAEIGQLTNLTRLNLYNNQLTGSIPPDIGQLTQLTELLSLASNQLTGSISPGIGQLTNLTELYLSSNQLTGTIPAEIGQLTNLTRLNLYNNQLTGSIPPDIGQLANLKLLYLWGNQLTGTIPQELGQLTRLEKLYLSSNQLTGIISPELGQLANLTVLNLHTNELIGIIPPDLGYLTLLTRLSLANNRLIGALEPELLQLVNLTELQLQGTQVCAPADVEFMDWLSGIAEQNVASCADARPGFAASDQREFDTRFAGKILSTTHALDIEFTSEGRFTEPVGGTLAGSYTYSITGTNSGRLTQLYDATGVRCITSLTFTAPAKGTLAYRCGTRTQYAESGLWRLANAPNPNTFDIEIFWVGEDPDASMVEAAGTAAVRWERVIADDLPDERFGASSETVTVDDLFDNGDYERLFGYVDDIVIYARIASIDGEKGTLASAGPYLIRSSSALPYVGRMTFDTDALTRLNSVALHDLILHEIAHALGFGTHLWKELDLLENPSIDPDDEPILPPPDTHFTGIEAIAGFDAVGGLGYSGAKVPVENEEGGAGTQDSHWRNSVIGPEELMDGFINPESTTPDAMSLITIRSLADLGYVVDETQADAYALPTTTFARRLAGTSENWIPLNCVVR